MNQRTQKEKKKKARKQLQATASFCIRWHANSMTEQKSKTDANPEAWPPVTHTERHTITLGNIQNARKCISFFNGEVQSEVASSVMAAK